MRRPLSITVIALLMILFGIAEVITGFSHSFFGISTALGTSSTLAAAALGGLYALAGVLVLTMRQWAAALALICLAIVIAGRIALVATGLFPLHTFEQTFAIVVGTGIAVAFTIYIGWRWRSFG
jgi:hypothetical protein